MFHHKTVKSVLLGLGIVLVGFFLVSRVIAQNDLERKLETYLQVLDIVKNDYVEKNVDDQKLVYGSIRGMLQSLNDPYSRFMEPSAYKEMKVRMGGSYSGIGIYIGIKNEQLVVIAPIEGTPAYAAKLKSGDKIMTIDEKSTANMALEEAVTLIRGPQGSTVKVGILRNGWKLPKDYEIKRAKIVIDSVKFKMLDHNIAYIRLITFENMNSADEFEKALRRAKKADGLIIDVRNNGGGLLQNAIEIGSMFVDNGMIVQTIDREGRREEIESTGRVLWKKPVVVLINEASASASEILAGALRDNKVAPLIGTKTFGKASVQNVRNLNDGSALLITIAKYLTPSGEDINKKGIAPDIEVVIPTAETEAKAEFEDPDKIAAEDVQLKKAEAVIRSKVNENANL